MLRSAAVGGRLRGVLHSFSGDAAFGRECLDLGLDVSFAGAVTYTNKKFEPLRAAVAAIPDDRILVETDSPYLVPHPLRGKQQRNEPAQILLTARRLAELRGRTLDELDPDNHGQRPAALPAAAVKWFAPDAAEGLRHNPVACL